MSEYGREGRAERIAELAAIERLAGALHPMAGTFVVSAVCGLGASTGIVFYLGRSWKVGFRADPPETFWVDPIFWEAVASAGVGALIGLGLSLPFAFWFLLQAQIARVQLRLEENTRVAGQRAAETAMSMKTLAVASVTGEFRARESGEGLGLISSEAAVVAGSEE